MKLNFFEVTNTEGSAFEPGNMECYYVNRVIKVLGNGCRFILREEIFYSDVPTASAQIFLWSTKTHSWNSLFQLPPASSSWMVQRCTGRIPDPAECAAEDLQTLENIAEKILLEMLS